MHLPSFWRQACFSVSESAELLGVPEFTLRTWLARLPFDSFAGKKTGGRVYLSGVDIYFWSIVRDLVGHGVGVRTAMLAARQFGEEAAAAMPKEEFLVVRKTAPSCWSFQVADEPGAVDGATLLIPMAGNAESLIHYAAQIYAKDSA